MSGSMDLSARRAGTRSRALVPALLGLAMLSSPCWASAFYMPPPDAPPPPAAAPPPPAPMPPPPAAALAPPAAEAVPAPTTPPEPPASGLAAELKGRWISYIDAAFTGAPQSEQQQMLAERCAGSYAIFEIKASHLVEDFRQGTNAVRTEYAIAAQDGETLAIRGPGVPGRAIFANVSLGQEQRLAEYGFPADVLVFDIRAPQRDGTRYPARKYARCPAQP